MTKTLDAYRFDKLMWSPEYVYGQGVLAARPSAFHSQGSPIVPTNSIYDTVRLFTTTFSSVVAGGDVVYKYPESWESNIPKGKYPFDTTAPLSDALCAGGQRMIGAVIEIEYLGKVDNIEGIVEIAMNTNTVNTKHCAAPLEDINFFSEDAIQQAPYYRRFRLSDGIKAIWFPMDEERFSFNECFQTIDTRDPLVVGTGTSGSPQFFDQNATRCFIFPTKNIGSLHATVGDYYLPPGAHQYANGYQDTKTPYRQDNEGLHEKARIEWAINFTGLTQQCPVRIYINQYYETIPHESEMDNFFPTLGPVGHTDVATKLIRQVSAGVTPTPANSSGALVANVLSKVWEIAKGMGGFVSNTLPGLINTAGTVAGGVFGGPLGAAAGSLVGNTASSLVRSVLGQNSNSSTTGMNEGKRIYDSVFVPADKTLVKPYRR